MVLEKILESLLDCKEIKPVDLKGNQPWIFIGRTDTENEAPMLWLPDAKNQLIGKDPDAGKDWRWVEKGMTGDEMAEWHHQRNGQEFEQAPGDGKPGVLQFTGSQRVECYWTTISPISCVLLKMKGQQNGLSICWAAGDVMWKTHLTWLVKQWVKSICLPSLIEVVLRLAHPPSGTSPQQ